jgi:hypothetical protein
LVELTEKQKEFIVENVQKMNVYQLTQELFGKHPSMTALSSEGRAISAYISTLPKSTTAKTDESEEQEYRAPRTLPQVMARINRYIPNGVEQTDKPSPKLKNDLEATIKYLNYWRLKQVINDLDDIIEKELFEATFIGYIYDKPDLTPEELDANINLCLDVVDERRLQERRDRLTTLFDGCAEDNEGKKSSVALANAISDVQNQLHQNRLRQQSARESLTGKRKDRISSELKQSGSIINLVRAWRLQEEREKMIKLAQKMEEKVAGEVDRLTSVDNLKAELFGIDKINILSFEE